MGASSAWWGELPAGFLRMSFTGWQRLDSELQELVVELARSQNFKCAMCDRAKKLIIEHDHYPEHGRSDIATIYNTRGLVCSRCNWHIGMYEADDRGDDRGWVDAYIYVGEREFYPYALMYRQRVRPILDAMLEKRLGSKSYLRRERALRQLDGWKDWDGKSPWRERYADVRAARRVASMTPQKFFSELAAIVRHVVDQQNRDHNYLPPETLLALLVRAKELMEDLVAEIEPSKRAELEARFKEQEMRDRKDSEVL